MNLRRTPLYDIHQRRKARLVPFAGWEMPVQYPTGILVEHQACRESAALFDASHMGELYVEGPDAAEFCRRMTPNDVDRLVDGQAQYTLLLNERGGVIDDVLLYRLASDRFMFCLNASRTEADIAHLSAHRFGEVRLADASEDTALIAVQGPRAIAGVAVGAPSFRLEALRPFEFRQGNLLGRPVLIGRTGYTGEDGLEIFCQAEQASAAWEWLMGLELQPIPAGLGARDTLRLEAGLPLYGHELDEDTNPLEAGLDGVVKFGASDFLGRAALERVRAEGPTRRRVHVALEGRGVLREGFPLFSGDRSIGKLTSGGYSPTYKVSVGMGLVDRASLETAGDWEVEIRGRKSTVRRMAGPIHRRLRRS